MVILTKNWKFGILGLILAAFIIIAIVSAALFIPGGDDASGASKVLSNLIEYLNFKST